MPPKNTDVECIRLYSTDGANYSSIPDALSASNIIDIVVSRETDYIRDQRLFSPQWALYGTLVFPHKKISRKKFKKLLMSKGINRDLAEWFCVAVSSFKGKRSYRPLYSIGLFSPVSKDLIVCLFDALFPIPYNQQQGD